MSHIQSLRIGLGLNSVNSKIRHISKLNCRSIWNHKCVTGTEKIGHSYCHKWNTYEINTRSWNKRLISTGGQSLCSIKEKSTVDDGNRNEEDKPFEENIVEKELREKTDLLSKEVLEFKDKYQRSLADRENLRQRLEKQIQEAKLFGIQSFCKDLLEVSDVFQKAIESVPKEKVKDVDPVFVDLYNGVVMTEKQLLSVFRRHGLERIIPVEGDKFDPSEQEAMFEAPGSEGKTPGTVAHIVRTGWKLHDRCIRSAQVGVFKE